MLCEEDIAASRIESGILNHSQLLVSSSTFFELLDTVNTVVSIRCPPVNCSPSPQREAAANNNVLVYLPQRGNKNPLKICVIVISQVFLMPLVT